MELDTNDAMKQHQARVQEIREELFYWRHNSSRNFSNFTHLTLSNRQHLHSNTVRENHYKDHSLKLGIEKLSHIISIDPVKQIAKVEPRLTMQELVNATLEYGLIPAVVPEFKGITVGGAIMGTALESSSHLYGQFNDQFLSYDILLGDGSIVHATPEEYSDLFYGLSGSYGTLGVLLLAEMQLIPASKYVRLSYHTFDQLSKAIEFMKEGHMKKLDYIEGILFHSSQVVVITGKLFKDGESLSGKSMLNLSKSSSPLFYQHVKRISDQKGCTRVYEEMIPIKDYLFRHDYGAFWMGGYVLHFFLLVAFLLNKMGFSIPQWVKKKVVGNAKSNFYPKHPNKLFRAVFGKLMNSQNLYKILHSGNEDWIQDQFVIQDFYMPEGKVKDFTEYVLREYGITPIWLCPLKATSTEQYFSPHFQQDSERLLLFDIGVYGLPEIPEPSSEITRNLEKGTRALGGRKMLYGYSYYPRKEFWQIYPEDKYRALRKQYHAEDVWLDIADKVLSKR